MSALRQGAQSYLRALIQDCQPHHAELFCGLTPPSQPYYAGNWRGSDFRCLKHYPVGVPGDLLVGTPPEQVRPDMERFREEATRHLAAFNIAALEQLSPKERLLLVAKFAARVFDLFLRIHPFANGNGHIARLLVLAILGAFKVFPKKWPVDARPPGPYGDVLYKARRGQPELLTEYLLRCIAGTI